jgi:Uma2 family endonuclease
MQVETVLVDGSFLPIVLDFRDVLEKISDDEFEKFCRHNPDIEIELTKEGELIIMPPTGGKTGIRNFSLNGYFFNWVEKDQSGVGFDSSTVFKLPNGAKRSPDLAWIKNVRWEKFPPLCPDFVVELRSPSDSVKNLQAKMEEYIENGASLGWLVDPLERKIYIYRPDFETETLENPGSVGGEPLLKNFSLKMNKIWS